MSVINRDVFSTSWNFSPLMDQRSEVGYVGVKNLGCTCYMNSLLQQFFMMPTFRQGILSLTFNSPSSTITMKEEQKGRLNSEDRQDELLFQLQVMFCHLQESTRRYYDPTVFCMVNKDYDGRPTNVRVQMDVDEFFNMLSEKLDNSLKNTSQPSLLKNTWGGTIASQLICKGCPHYSEREEPFYTISLDIKNKSSIKEALELYVQGEMLEGDNAYFCDACKKLVDALKRSCIKTLPDTLILHLKRFEFNFDNFRKMKVNDRCDFPQVLDMDPYTKQSLARRDNPNSEESMDLDSRSNLYQLAGVLVHRGVADSGHYYSFIKVSMIEIHPFVLPFFPPFLTVLVFRRSDPRRTRTDGGLSSMTRQYVHLIPSSL
jgi:ubiquitin C-terminal hydrolase